ncbi:MAG: hypothetical protein ACE5KW_02700, partial [Dehalococcoidia bacterium]
MSGKSLWLIPLLLLAAVVAFVACDDGDGDGDISGASVDVLGIWGGDPELPSFRAMVAPWETDTGASVDFTGSREITSLLTTRVEGGDP